MDDSISLSVAARLNGDSDGTYRSAISQYLPELGRRRGKERVVSLWETIALRTLTELSSAKLSLKEAAQRVVGLYPFIREIARGTIGQGKVYVFAVELWGRQGGRYRRSGYICEGDDAVAQCVGQAALGGWPNMRIINLTHLLVETGAGWDIALLGPEMAAEALRERLAEAKDHERGMALELFQEMAARLDRFGDRRQAPPANTEWHRWEPGPPQTQPAA